MLQETSFCKLVCHMIVIIVLLTVC